MSPTRPHFPAYLRITPLPPPLGEHDQGEKKRRQRITRMLEEPGLPIYTFPYEPARSLLNDDPAPAPWHPSAWPSHPALYIQMQDPVLLGDPDAMTYLSGLLVVPHEEFALVTPAGMQGLHVFDIEHRQDLPSGRVSLNAPARRDPPELEPQRAASFYRIIAANLPHLSP